MYFLVLKILKVCIYSARTLFGRRALRSMGIGPEVSLCWKVEGGRWKVEGGRWKVKVSSCWNSQEQAARRKEGAASGEVTSGNSVLQPTTLSPPSTLILTNNLTNTFKMTSPIQYHTKEMPFKICVWPLH